MSYLTPHQLGQPDPAWEGSSTQATMQAVRDLIDRQYAQDRRIATGLFSSDNRMWIVVYCGGHGVPVRLYLTRSSTMLEVSHYTITERHDLADPGTLERLEQLIIRALGRHPGLKGWAELARS